MTTVGFLIVLGVVVTVHELGHFLAARWAGMKVDTFSIGFGRAIFKWHDRRGTEWRIAWLPLGGFVQPHGQEDMFDREKYDALTKKEKAGHYLSAPAWKQAVVMASGVLMNLALSFVIYTGLFVGSHTVQLPIVGHSEAAEILTGDRIMQINGRKIGGWNDIPTAKELSADDDSSVVILRGEKLVILKMPPGKWGISPDTDKIEMVRYGLFGAIGRGAAELWTQSKIMITIIWQMISGARSSEHLGGLLTIAEFSGRALSDGLAVFLKFIALISLNLMIINLVPIPVFDGGHLLILGLQAALRRKFRGRAIEWVMRIGWGLFLMLIAFTFWNDIYRLFVK